VSKRIQISVPHRLPAEDALARVHALGKYFQNRHGMSMRWESERVGHLAGRYLLISIDGRFSVDERAVHLDGQDPGLLLRAKATDYLRGKLETYLDPATPLADLPTA
jgi:hypothetical protein